MTLSQCLNQCYGLLVSRLTLGLLKFMKLLMADLLHLLDMKPTNSLYSSSHLYNLHGRLLLYVCGSHSDTAQLERLKGRSL